MWLVLRKMARTWYTPDIDEHLRDYFLKAENYLQMFIRKLYLYIKHLNFVNIHTQTLSQRHSTHGGGVARNPPVTLGHTHSWALWQDSENTGKWMNPSTNQASFLGAWLSWLLSSGTLTTPQPNTWLPHSLTPDYTLWPQLGMHVLEGLLHNQTVSFLKADHISHLAYILFCAQHETQQEVARC